MSDCCEEKGGFFPGLMWGGLVGAGLVFLFATKKGRKIKDQLTLKGQELIDDLPNVVADLEKQGQEFAKKAEEVKEVLEKKAIEFSPQAKEKISKTLAAVQKTQAQSSQVASKIRRKFFTKKGKKLH